MGSSWVLIVGVLVARELDTDLELFSDCDWLVVYSNPLPAVGFVAGLLGELDPGAKIHDICSLRQLLH